MTEAPKPTVIGEIAVTASAEVVPAAEVRAQHDRGDHTNCGHDREQR